MPDSRPIARVFPEHFYIRPPQSSDDPKAMRPRPFALVLAALIPACSTPTAYVPAPWDATEPQGSEPASIAPRVPLTPRWSRVGASIRGKSLQAVTVGSGQRRIYIIGGIHGDEPEAPAAAVLLPELLVESTDPLSTLTASTVRILQDMNPDGGAARTRTNTRRVDLERNWPSKDFRKDDRSGDRPLSELETAAVYKDLLDFKPDIVIVFQSANLPPSISSHGSSPRLAHEFASAARQVDPRWRFNPVHRHRAPGSIESLFGNDMGKVVFRVEFQRNRPADTDARAVLAGLLALDRRPSSPPSAAPATAAAAPDPSNPSASFTR
jgi:murein peptide amidase A